jgi:lysozyme family protein
MPEPYLAPSLSGLQHAINTRWPHRDHSSDGWIGDKAHAARTSDHNPDPVTGVVRAIDLDKDGVHIPTVLTSMFLHPSTRYVIHRRRIWHIDNLFKPKDYTGSNPHTEHVHDSIEHSKVAENSSAPWLMIATAPAWKTLKSGMVGTSVRQAQAYLNGHMASLVVDGRFGPATLAAVRAFQRRNGLKVDGWLGPQTLGALRTK